MADYAAPIRPADYMGIDSLVSFVMARNLTDEEISKVQEIYIDETSQNGVRHRFLILGGITIPLSLSRVFEREIKCAKAATDITSRQENETERARLE
jgi:hypothetical protein